MIHALLKTVYYSISVVGKVPDNEPKVFLMLLWIHPLSINLILFLQLSFPSWASHCVSPHCCLVCILIFWLHGGLSFTALSLDFRRWIDQCFNYMEPVNWFLFLFALAKVPRKSNICYEQLHFLFYFIHLSFTYLLNYYYVLRTVLSSGEVMVNLKQSLN